jgi:hypothetical protein
VIARALLAAGAAIALLGTFLPFLDLTAGIGIDPAGNIRKGEKLNYWEVSGGSDVLLLVLCVVVVACSAARPLVPVALLAAAVLAGATLNLLLDWVDPAFLEAYPVGVWTIPAGGIVALTGAALALLRQRSTRAA